MEKILIHFIVRIYLWTMVSLCSMFIMFFNIHILCILFFAVLEDSITNDY